MRCDEVAMMADVETYGLAYFEGSVGKGHISLDEIVYLLELHG